MESSQAVRPGHARGDISAFSPEEASPMKDVGGFKKARFDPARELVIDIVKLGVRKHHVPILLELDVTDSRNLIRLQKQRTGVTLSFTGWVTKCIAQAVSEHQEMHALRKGSKALILFDDVDVLVTIEKAIDELEVPLPFVVRKANKKTVSQINDEIRSAQRETATRETMVLGDNPWYARIYLRLPGVVRGLIGPWMLRDPFAIKRNTGTVAVSSIGMMGNFGGWVIPVGPLPLQFAVGGIARKPGVHNDQIEAREILSLSFVFDHDVVDGAPVARFTSRLVELMESAFALDEAGLRDNPIKNG